MRILLVPAGYLFGLLIRKLIGGINRGMLDGSQLDTLLTWVGILVPYLFLLLGFLAAYALGRSSR